MLTWTAIGRIFAVGQRQLAFVFENVEPVVETGVVLPGFINSS